MSTSADRLVEDYLDRLERELADFPSARRRELVQEISEHIAEARSALETETEADVRNLLDRMGDPADIAAEAHEVPLAPRADRLPELSSAKRCCWAPSERFSARCWESSPRSS